MSFNEHYFNAAMDRLSKRRSDNRIITDLRRQEIYEKLPEYRELSERLAETGHKLILLIMQGGEVAEGVSQLEQDNRNTQRCMAELLKKAGYPADYLEPVYTIGSCWRRLPGSLTKTPHWSFRPLRASAWITTRI